MLTVNPDSSLIASPFAFSADTIMSTRAFNQIVDVAYLHENGIGNKGETLYDLFNAVTQYYTSGDGTGHDDGSESKAWKKYTSSTKPKKTKATNRQR